MTDDTSGPILDPGCHSPIHSGPGLVLLVGTRKGAWVLRPDEPRSAWRTAGPLFLGHIIHHFVLDSRDGRTLLMAARAGHLGPTVFRSVDGGVSWREARQPPAFPKPAVGKRVRTVEQVFWLSPGHASEPDVWYAGTAPEGLFRSEDGGDSWRSVSGWNEHPCYDLWAEDPSGEQKTPDGSPLHSIQIDPRDPAHMYLATSGGGVFESTDQGGDWRPLNGNVEANFLPAPEPPEYGQDTHCLQLHPMAPDVLYQQNHCGIYRLDRPRERWVRIGDHMPREVGDIGFPIGLHPRDPNTAWVFPMDGTDVWPRTSPDGRPAVYRTRDGGEHWNCIAPHLPQVYSLEAGEIAGGKSASPNRCAATPTAHRSMPRGPPSKNCCATSTDATRTSASGWWTRRTVCGPMFASS